jgi:twinkle protein
MLNKPEDQIDKASRTSAKIINFGALYGAGAKTIQKQAVAQYGVDMPLREAEEKLSQWRRAYPQLIGWQKTQGNRAELQVKTLMGRRRLLVPGETDRFTVRLNTQVQGTGGDCMKAALAMLWESYLAVNPDMRLVACVHDECVMEVPEDRVQEAMDMLKHCMEAAAYEVCITNVPIVAEPGFGDDWSAK